MKFIKLKNNIPNSILLKYVLKVTAVVSIIILILIFISLIPRKSIKNSKQSRFIIEKQKPNNPQPAIIIDNNIINNKKNNMLVNNEIKNDFNNKEFINRVITKRDNGSNSNSTKLKQEILKNLERIVHIDLKGAPPKISYFDSFIPLLKENGATGVLLEYEDTFPFQGNLKEAQHSDAYSLDDVRHIKKLCIQNGLYIIPLVQTYGHLEWLLKLEKFKHLRDSAENPQVITQCLNESYTLIYDMLDQVINEHLDSPYFHIGCDEVYFKLQHPKCAEAHFENNFMEAFMMHLVTIAGHVRSKMPKTKIIFWNDMLNNMPNMIFEKYRARIFELELEPMIWAYVLNVHMWFQSSFYHQYGLNFKNVWAATAYKGASGELATFTSIQERNENHVTWMEVILEKNMAKIVNFRGIALTGWSRYDHFLTLCDILPQAIPSLVFNLQTVKYGQKLSNEKINEITTQLGCTNKIPWTLLEVQYSSYIQCNFPGHELYKVVIQLESIKPNLAKNLEYAQKYMSPMNSLYNYIHSFRSVELMPQLKRDYDTLIRLKNEFFNFGQKYYHNETLNEWTLVYLIPHLDPVYNMIMSIKNNKNVNSWKPRSLNITIRNYPDNI